jgi:glycosyltransferase involved in cell wall biosynthesis
VNALPLSLPNTQRGVAPLTCSVVVPVYNSQATLPALVEQLNQVMLGVCDRFEIILVNDSSRDQSWPVIVELAHQYPWVKGINLMRNFGQHSALLCGLRTAQYEVAVTVDELAEGWDVVYGSPLREVHGFWRYLANKITRLALQGVMGFDTAQKVSAFRVFRTQLRDAFATYQDPFVSIDVLLTWGTTRFTSVQVRRDPRREGVSNYTFGKLLRHAINMMTGFSVVPLQLASLIGFGFTLFGLGVLAYVLIRYLIAGGSVAGFPFLASIIAIFSGAQLFALGIMGEYLARIHFRVMQRPAYAIREVTSSSTPENGVRGATPGEGERSANSSSSEG